MNFLFNSARGVKKDEYPILAGDSAEDFIDKSDVAAESLKEEGV